MRTRTLAVLVALLVTPLLAETAHADAPPSIDGVWSISVTGTCLVCTGQVTIVQSGSSATLSGDCTNGLTFTGSYDDVTGVVSLTAGTTCSVAGTFVQDGCLASLDDGSGGCDLGGPTCTIAFTLDGFADGTPCDDGNQCTASDACSSGSCVGTGQPGAPCDDVVFCNGADQCSAGPVSTCSVHADDPCPGPDGDANCTESCNEAMNDCSADDPPASACDDGLFCTGFDHCSGGPGSTCSVHEGHLCPGPDGDGDCSESCNETADDCSLPDPAASPCDDGKVCFIDDVCDGAGTCNGSAPSSCSPAVAGKAQLQIKDSGDNAKDQLHWKWKSQNTFDVGELGNPAATDDLTLCLYGTTLQYDATAPHGGICNEKPCWTVDVAKVKYKIKSGSPDGITQLQAKSGGPGKGSLQIKSKGGSVLAPAIPITPPVRALLLRNDGPECWEANFSAPSKNENGAFKAKSD